MQGVLHCLDIMRYLLRNHKHIARRKLLGLIVCEAKLLPAAKLNDDIVPEIVV